MPVLNRVAEMQDEIAGWRRTLHQQPELDFAVYKTAEFVQQKLAEFGVDEIATGIGRTGVVGIIKGSKGAGATIGLRADMDALPMQEITGKAYQSQTPGVAHACGHDGHTAMLLGAAKYLAETRNFAGSVAVIFQPAEEGGGGGREMVQDGMMDRFGIDRVFGMHNLPNLPVGKFAIKPGAIMAATAEFTIVVKGRGGHAAMPHTTIDPISIGTQLVTALQSIVSRNANPVESLVVTVTKFHAGDAYNVIPERADIAGTVRALKQDLAVLAEKRMKEICNGLAVAHGIEIELDYDANYPVTMNDPVEAVFAGAVAAEVAGAANVDLEAPPLMAGEDFSYMLEARPGAFIFLGNGGSAPLHHPAYDFDDTAIAHGVSYWIRIAETALAT
ncbi:MAG: M20 family metallopeptidase [Rhizobiaceae bacterium]|nr:M20 family metallopeptidase [Rhizobiaceae bacterium]